MTIKHLTDFSDQDWWDAYTLVYSPRMAAYMGVNPMLIQNRPTLVDFYKNVMAAYKEGRFNAWAAFDKNQYIGHVILDKSIGEWELGVVIPEAKHRNGLGARLAKIALAWAFNEQQAPWVVAFAQGEEPKVKEMLVKAGFVPMMNFFVMSRDTWVSRWPKLARRTD